MKTKSPSCPSGAVHMYGTLVIIWANFRPLKLHFEITFSNFDTSWNQTDLYWYQTSFDQKYDHFSLLCKQMDIYLRKVYIVRKVTSAPTFLPFTYMLQTFLSVWRISHVTSSKNRFLKPISCDQLYQFWSSCLLYVQIKNIAEIL